MTNTPEQDAAGQWNGETQQGELSRPPAQPTAPGAEQYGSGPSGAASSTAAPSGSGPAQPSGGAMAAGQQRTQPVGGRMPVSEAQTRVSGRRVFQYFIDAFLISVIPFIVSIPFDVSSHTSLHIIGGIVTFVLFVIISFWYWNVWPRGHNGQTFAMKWFGLRVVSKNGGPANTGQYVIRWLGLIIDGFPWIWPFTGLLGLLVMVVSRYRQRVGDHMARTLVISEGLTPAQVSQYGEPGPEVLRSDQLPQQERPETGL